MKKKIINILSIVILVVVCIIYLYSKGTYTIYESNVDGSIKPEIAKWEIKVNDVLVTASEVLDVDISNIEWVVDHVRENKVAPGSSGVLNVNIDPLDTGVAIRYDIEIIDKSVEPQKVLTLDFISDSLGKLVRTGENTYTGIISLNDISSGNIVNVAIGVSWVDDGMDIDYDQVMIEDDYLTINFKASQYNGDEIISYTGD